MKQFLVLLILMLSRWAEAQDITGNIITQNLMWYGYYLTIDFGDKWRLVSEAQERHFVDPLAQHQWLLRSRLYRKMGKNWEVALGAVHFWSSPNEPCNRGNCLVVPEIRTDQTVVYRQALNSRWLLRHRYIIEERFFRNHSGGVLRPGYHFRWRHRYMLTAEYDLFPVKKTERNTQLRLAQEIFVQSGSHFFDHYRAYIGYMMPFSQHWDAEIGYLFWFQQRSERNQFFQRNILRLSLSHRIAW